MKKSAFIKKIAEAVIESIREEHFEIPYLRQIAAAQEYLNANRNADLSHVKCLLRWIMPKEYHDEIDKLHEREDPQFVCIINGGQNLIAPNAQQAETPSLSASSTAARTSSPRTRSRQSRTYRIVHPKNEYILHRQLNIYCNRR